MAEMIWAAETRNRRRWRKLAKALVPSRDPRRLFAYLMALVTLLEFEAFGGAGSEIEILQLVEDRSIDWRAVTAAPLSVFRDALTVACVGIPPDRRYIPEPSTGDLILALAVLLKRSGRSVGDLRQYAIANFDTF